MARYARTALLVAAIATLAGLDWMVGPAGAEDEATGETAAPQVIPGFAFMTGEGIQDRATIDGVEVRAARVANGVELAFRNASGLGRVMDLEVHCIESSGSPMSRMGPISVERKVERVRLELVSGQRATRRIRLATTDEGPAQAGGASNRNAVMPAVMGFSSWSFTIVPAGEEVTPEHARTATLRLPEPTAPPLVAPAADASPSTPASASSRSNRAARRPRARQAGRVGS